MENNQQGWLENRTVIIAWLIFFFPVGLYAVWKSNIFSKKNKQIITAIVVGVILFFMTSDLQGTRDFLHLFILCPVILYLLWRDNNVARTTIYAFGGGFVFLLAIYMSGSAAMSPNPEDCTGVFEQNGCTYFRDSNCVVISQDCS